MTKEKSVSWNQLGKIANVENVAVRNNGAPISKETDGQHPGF